MLISISRQSGLKNILCKRSSDRDLRALERREATTGHAGVPGCSPRLPPVTVGTDKTATNKRQARPATSAWFMAWTCEKKGRAGLLDGKGTARCHGQQVVAGEKQPGEERNMGESLKGWGSKPTLEQGYALSIFPTGYKGWTFFVIMFTACFSIN